MLSETAWPARNAKGDEVRRAQTVRSMLLVGLLVMASISTVTFLPAQPASAATGSNFDPGNIISDQKFNDSYSMSAGQIQSFLVSQMPTCASGYTCLKDFTQVTYSKASDARCAAYAGSTGESAASIISKVGLACGISQQVLLVLLQKEQALVSSSHPSQWAYDHATGYACPDTAACDPSYSGFFDQVYHAASQFRYYELNPTAFRYQAGKVVDILYNPDVGCGTQRVYIQNQATANLYIYTPYVPNAVALNNLYGLGNDCSAYGNRNFWAMFSDWFGSPSGPKSTNGSLDFAAGTVGGINVQGWAVDPFAAGANFIWVNIDGTGGPAQADLPLNWIETLYPGLGNQHGYDLTIPSSPGSHVVCVLQTNGVSLGCRTVVVPSSTRAAGEMTVIPSLGKLTVSGWSLDKTTSAPTYVWVNVDGMGGPVLAAGATDWATEKFTGTGTNHAFTIDLPTIVGRHQVCVYGTDSAVLGCKSVDVPKNEAGAVESRTGVIGGIQTTGWSLDQRTAASTYVWVTTDGSGGPAFASATSTASTTAFPKLGGSHGYTYFSPAKPGRHIVCVTGTLEQTPYGCSVVVVPNNEVGHIDSVVGVTSGIQIDGWSLNQTSSASTYIWIDVDGKGSAYAASVPLAWMNGYFPGVGAAHGVSAFVPASIGKHTVCVTGTQENVSLGCFTVTVPSTGAGSLDTVTAGVGTISLSGWAVDRAGKATMYIWTKIDANDGFPVAADQFLPWIDAYFPGVGSNHGFTATAKVTPGPHMVCVTLTFDDSSLGCKTVTVQ